MHGKHSYSVTYHPALFRIRSPGGEVITALPSHGESRWFESGRRRPRWVVSLWSWRKERRPFWSMEIRTLTLYRPPPPWFPSGITGQSLPFRRLLSNGFAVLFLPPLTLKQRFHLNCALLRRLPRHKKGNRRELSLPDQARTQGPESLATFT